MPQQREQQALCQAHVEDRSEFKPLTRRGGFSASGAVDAIVGSASRAISTG
jgi:hypothetical protein